jgi:hypothetical protein
MTIPTISVNSSKVTLSSFCCFIFWKNGIAREGPFGGSIYSIEVWSPVPLSNGPR